MNNRIRKKLEIDLEKVEKELARVMGAGLTLRLESRKVELLKQLGREEEAKLIEDYIKKYL